MLNRCLIFACVLAALVTGMSCATTKHSSMRRLVDGNCDRVLSNESTCIQRPGRQAQAKPSTETR